MNFELRASKLCLLNTEVIMLKDGKIIFSGTGRADPGIAGPVYTPIHSRSRITMPRSQQKLTFSELRVGIFMLAALLVTGFLILNSSGRFQPV